jgi:Tol biopolymer transport system component
MCRETLRSCGERLPPRRVVTRWQNRRVVLQSDEATDAAPLWSPDGKRIVFRANPGGLYDLYLTAANGSGSRTLLLKSQYAKYPTDWLPDGRGIVYHTFERDTGSDIWLVTPDGSQARPLVQTPFDDMQGQVSPDGRWLAYASLETGQAEAYVGPSACVRVGRVQLPTSAPLVVRSTGGQAAGPLR